jgi:hypothetical protein
MDTELCCDGNSRGRGFLEYKQKPCRGAERQSQLCKGFSTSRGIYPVLASNKRTLLLHRVPLHLLEPVRMFRYWL